MDPDAYLQLLIRHQAYITCPLLSADQFRSKCRERGITCSFGDLEHLERHGLFWPIARIARPTYHEKIEYVEGGRRYRPLGKLEPGEKWQGPTFENLDWFSFRWKGQEWYEAGRLWAPESRPFKPWADYARDRRGVSEMVSYYSLFQIPTLSKLRESGSIRVDLAGWGTASAEKVENLGSQLQRQAEKFLEAYVGKRTSPLSSVSTSPIDTIRILGRIAGRCSCR